MMKILMEIQVIHITFLVLDSVNWKWNTLTYALYTNNEVNVMEILIVKVNGVFLG